MCLISPTQKFKLEKSTLNTKKWGKLRFDEILELWIFILEYFVAPAFCLIPVSQGSIFLLLHNNAWQKKLKKRLLIPILHIFAYLVSIHSKVWIQQQTSCLHQRLVSLAWFLFVPEISFVSPLSEFEQHMYNSDPRPVTSSLINAVGEP